jgi:replication-associated recombination protein RarA
MKSSKETLKNLKVNLDYLTEQQNNMQNYYIVEQVQESVYDLEQIINELTEKTELLDKALILMDEIHTMTVNRITS